MLLYGSVHVHQDIYRIHFCHCTFYQLGISIYFSATLVVSLTELMACIAPYSLIGLAFYALADIR